MRRFRWFFVALAATGCGLPTNVNPMSVARLNTRDTTLGELVAPAVAKHPGESGFLLFNTWLTWRSRASTLSISSGVATRSAAC